VSYLLAVIGTQDTVREEISGVIRDHLESGKIWQARPGRRLASGSRLVAKMAGVSELWMTGTLLSTEERFDPNPHDPERWPYSYDVGWDPPPARGVAVRETLLGTAVPAPGL